MNFSLGPEFYPNNTNVGSPNLLTGKVEFSNYGYIVSPASTYIFTAAFGLSFALHVFEGIWFRVWWSLYTLGIGALLETLGWAGRIWAVTTYFWDPTYGGSWDYSFGSFIMQDVCTIIAPAFMAAANYIILRILINATNNQYSSFSPREYTATFITGDVISILVQAAGGGIAGSANTDSGSNLGARVMVGGIFFQILVMIAYTLLFIEFTYRYLKDRRVARYIAVYSWWPFGKKNGRNHASAPAAPPVPPKRTFYPLSPMTEEELKDIGTSAGSSTIEDRRELVVAEQTPYVYVNRLLCLCGISTFLIFVRSIYRSIELIQGWSGAIATNQVLFCVLDGALMAILLLTFNVSHPGMSVRRKH